MTQKAAIAYALLKGEVISIKTAFDQFGCSNAPREIGRSIERSFGVRVSRMQIKFKSRYGKSGVYFQYRLNRDSKENQDGILKMKEYVMSEMKTNPFDNHKIVKGGYNQSDLFGEL